MSILDLQITQCKQIAGFALGAVQKYVDPLSNDAYKTYISRAEKQIGT